MNAPVWLSLPDAARRAGIGWRRLLGLIRSGAVPAHLCGGRRWFVRAEDVRALRRRPR